LSYAIFPDDDYTVHYGNGVIGDDVERGRIGNTEMFSMYLVGCVDYQFVGHAAHHQTRFAYEVIPRGHSLKIGENVPMENLTLRKVFFGGDYAD
jgi:hypothetical protein